MKLLGWMHRKFRQNSSEPLKDFALGHACNCLTGQPSLEDQQYYQKQNYGPRQFRQVQRDNLRKSFAGMEAARVEEEDDYEEESSAAISELFHGFLAIGTLGSDAANTDPSTPTFAINVENITEKETEVTKNELKLINDELEKVLIADARDDYCNDSSGRNSYVSAGRNSYVSAGRSSHGSTITLGGKLIDGEETNGNGTTVCPLQGYLFGSAIEMSETTPTVAKKENRTSLGELFQRTKMAEDNYGSKIDREEKRTEKEAEKSAVFLMKRILKKKMLHASSKSTTSANGSADTTSAETKLHKILHMFHRKVHPENSTSTGKTEKSHKIDTRKKNNSCIPGVISGGDPVESEEDITIIPRISYSKRSLRRFKSQSNPPHFMLTSSDSNGSRECWINTDADYLVLEL